MDWEQACKDLIANYWVKESQWRFDTSAGGEAAFTTPGVKIGIAATGGAIWVKESNKARSIKLTYGGVGATVGFRNLVPCPINFSFSLPAMTSRGRIYQLPAAGKTLSLSELKGGLLAFEISGDVGAGWTQAAIFMGGNYHSRPRRGRLSPWRCSQHRKPFSGSAACLRRCCRSTSEAPATWG